MKKIAFMAALAAVSGAFAAAPEFKYSNLTFEAPATAEEIAAAKTEILSNPRNSTGKVQLVFKGTADEATLAAAVAAFPDAKRVDIDVKNTISSVAALANLTAAKQLAVKNVLNLDVSPLAGLSTVEKLSLSYSQVADLSPVGKMSSLKEVDFYGSTLVDFSPLASLPKLELVYFYAAKLPAAGYDSLGKLKQVKKFHGGLTKMTSLAWLREVPQIEELKIFAEKFDDLTPIAECRNLTYFRAWNMDGGKMACGLGDLSFLANCKKLKKLELTGSAYTDTAVIGTLPEIKELDVSGAKNVVDLAFAANLQKLESIALPDKRCPGVKNFDALGKCASLKSVSMRDTAGVDSIAPLAACPALRSVTVAKGAFPEAEIAALEAKKGCKVYQR